MPDLRRAPDHICCHFSHGRHLMSTFRGPVWTMLHSMAIVVVTSVGVSRLNAQQGAALPRPDGPFQGVANRTLAGSKPDFPKPVAAPKDAPNVLLVLVDDAGFGNPSAFGGPCQTPT